MVAGERLGAKGKVVILSSDYHARKKISLGPNDLKLILFVSSITNYQDTQNGKEGT